MKKLAAILSALLLACLFVIPIMGCSSGGGSASASAVSAENSDASSTSSSAVASSTASAVISVSKDGEYTDKDHVALYIHEYGKLPNNYVTKTKARKAGWNSKEGNLWDVLPGKSIGGGEFYNDEEALPDAPGRTWYECDIDYEGGFRNAKRIVFSNDGLIYYTNDHYKSFQRLY